MKKTFLVMFILAAVAVGAWFFVTQAGGSKRLLSYVPKTSELVLSFNLKSLSKKTDSEQVKNLKMIQSLFSQTDGEMLPILKKVVQDPSNSGIKFTDNPHFFLSKTNSTGGLLLGLKKAASFSSLIEAEIGSHPIQTTGTIHYALSSDGPLILWNEETALIYMAKDTSGILANGQEILAKTLPSIEELTLYKDAHIKGADIFLYLQSSFMEKTPTEYFGLNFKKQAGAIAYGLSLKFEEGQIAFESRTAFEKKEDAKLTRMYSNNAGEHFLAFTTPKTPLMSVQLQLNTAKLYALLMDNPTTKSGLEEIAADFGVKTKELKDLFSGNIALSMSGLETRIVKKNFFGIESNEEVNTPEAALFVEVKNQELFQKILDKSEQHPEDGKYTFAIPFVSDFYMVHIPEGLSIMMDPELAKNFATEKTLSNSEFGAIGAFLKKHPNGAYVNLDLQGYPVKLKELLSRDMGKRYTLLETALKPFSDVFGYQVKERGYLNIKLINKEENSLRQVLSVMDVLYQMNQDILSADKATTEEAPIIEEDTAVYP